MTLDVFFSEEETVALLKEKDLRGLHYLYNKFGTAMHGVIFRILPDENLAEETLQETFVKIWQQSASYDTTKHNLYSWILSIARKLATEKLKSANIVSDPNPKPQIPINKLQSVDDEDFRPEKIGLPEVNQILRHEQKELIDLIYFKGYSQAEAAEKLRIPLGTVKTRVRSAMVELKKLFLHA